MTLILTDGVNTPVQTRDGRKARLLAVDVKNGTYPIVAVIECTDGMEVAPTYTEDGRKWDTAECPDDLINVPQKREAWLVLSVRGLACAATFTERAAQQIANDIDGGTVVRVEYELPAEAIEARKAGAN